MLQLRNMGLLHLDVVTAAGISLGEVLDCWQESKRRFAVHQHLQEISGNNTKVLQARDPYQGLAPHEKLPDDTRLWAALQRVSGGTWGGCVYDLDQIIDTLEVGMEQMKTKNAGLSDSQDGRSNTSIKTKQDTTP